MKKVFLLSLILLALTSVMAYNLANAQDTSQAAAVEITAAKRTLTTFISSTTTDSTGYFSVAHEISPKLYAIQGIIVAIQHTNGNWHTLEYSNSIDNRFWWNDTYVQGIITASWFAKRPVKITIFALPLLSVITIAPNPSIIPY